MKIKFQTAFDDAIRYALTVSPIPNPAKKPLSKIVYGGRINSSTYDAARAAEFDDKTVAAVKRYYEGVEPAHDIRNLEFVNEIVEAAA